MSPSWTTACPDWESRILLGQSLVPFDPLFPDEAAAALDVFRSLRIVDAPGSPTIGESCRPWVTDYAGAVFGSYDAETGRRLIRNYLLCVSKKNWKSGLAASIMMTALIRNWRQENEYLILAPTIEVAANSFGPAAAMVKADEELSDLFIVQSNIRTITHRLTGAKLKIVAADNDTVSGKKAAGVLVDELWLFGKRPNAEAMLREACGGLVSRPEGFVVYLTTMSDAPPAGVFKQHLNYFRDVRDGKIKDDKSLGVIYEFPKAMVDQKAHLEPSNFYVTNPNLGLSVDREWLLDEFVKAQNTSDESLCGFAAKHLNIEIGTGLRSDRWAGSEFWDRQADPTLTLETLLERSEVVTVGLDGGGLDDLYGMAVIGRDRETKDWLLWSKAWAHRSVLTRRKSIASILMDFSVADEITIVEDSLGDVGEIIEIIGTIKDSGLLAEVWVDPAGLGEMVDALAEIDIAEENDTLKGAPQGYAMMNAIKGAERKLANGTFWHGGSGLMKWCVSNVKIEPTATAIRATKASAGDAKIDPVMAMFDAVIGMSKNPGAKVSVYEDIDARPDGLLIL